MDAIKFLEEYKRMCDSFENCVNCPLLTEACDNFKNSKFVKKAVPIVEEWSATHPRKTRQSVFLEQYPNCMTNDDGVVMICPRNVDKTYVCDLRRPGGCADCRREFWTKWVE